MAVINTGAEVVRSCQSISANPEAIRIATKSSAGAVANKGTLSASGETNKANKNSSATTQAVRPVRPPAATPL